MTIEAAVVMPITIIIVALLIYLGFYLYDRTALYCDAYIASQKAVENPDMKNTDAMDLAMGSMGMLMNDQLIATGQMEYEVSVTYESATVGYSGNVEAPFVAEDGIFGEWQLFNLDGRLTMLRHKPVTDVRLVRKISGLFKR